MVEGIRLKWGKVGVPGGRFFTARGPPVGGSQMAEEGHFSPKVIGW